MLIQIMSVRNYRPDYRPIDLLLIVIIRLSASIFFLYIMRLAKPFLLINTDKQFYSVFETYRIHDTLPPLMNILQTPTGTDSQIGNGNIRYYNRGWLTLVILPSSLYLLHFNMCMITITSCVAYKMHI